VAIRERISSRNGTSASQKSSPKESHIATGKVFGPYAFASISLKVQLGIMQRTPDSDEQVELRVYVLPINVTFAAHREPIHEPTWIMEATSEVAASHAIH
jgi:hypothetical protein